MSIQAHAELGQYEQAEDWFQRSSRSDSNYYDLWLSWEWQMATAQDASYRDGKRVLEYAGKGSDLTSRYRIRALETLAAAHAELGDFDAAVTRQSEAIDALDSNAPAERQQVIRERLTLYESRRSLRDR